MNTDRDCGCKSYRTCLVCEEKYGLARDLTAEGRLESYPRLIEFEPELGGLRGVDERFRGVQVFPDFISAAEEARLASDLDLLPWDTSQSGRRKQNFGPRANFKGRKVKVGAFAGFPAVTKFVQDRFATLPCLEDYRAVEQCSIEYRPETGACIEPHIDDCWIWGDRIVQLNLLSDSVLTFFPYEGTDAKYNLADLPGFPRVLSESGEKVLFNPFRPDPSANVRRAYQRGERLLSGAAVTVPLPRRSLLVLHGEARYEWEHCILRRDIGGRRVVIAYRELTPPFLPGGEHQKVGGQILDRAAVFW